MSFTNCGKPSCWVCNEATRKEKEREKMNQDTYVVVNGGIVLYAGTNRENAEIEASKCRVSVEVWRYGTLRGYLEISPPEFQYRRVN